MSSTSKLKKALIHDWYYVDGGAEKVVHSFNTIWNDFNHYASIDFLNDKDRAFILNGKTATTSFIQKLPGAKTNHRKYLQLFPYAIEQFNLSNYDLILSSSASIAKGVLTHHNQLHICYCHSPMRYAWDFYHDYLERTKLQKGIKGIYAKYVLHKMRQWDLINTNRVDYFIANSNYIANRIKKLYRRDATVIYPPIDVKQYKVKEHKEDYYFTASRLVPYKKIDLIVKAFNKMPNKTLIVAGDGQDFKKIKRLAESNIKLKGYLSQDELSTYMQNAKAFVFAAEEDFGIVPLEAQACGTPVIAYGKGGLLETVIDGVTGTFFYNQTEDDIIKAVSTFETLTFNAKTIRTHAEQFSKERFETEILNFVEEKYNVFKANKTH